MRFSTFVTNHPQTRSNSPQAGAGPWTRTGSPRRQGGFFCCRPKPLVPVVALAEHEEEEDEKEEENEKEKEK